MLCDMSTSDAWLILTIRIIEFRALVWYATDQLPIIDIFTSAVSNKKIGHYPLFSQRMYDRNLTFICLNEWL